MAKLHEDGGFTGRIFNYLVGGKMSSENNNNGIGFTGVLAIVFITLKLLGVITWSWWWVLSPFWIPIVLVLGILLVAGIVFGITALFALLLD